MNDDVTWPMDNAEFNDWHLFLQFQSEIVEVLRCPEDVKCCSRDNVSRRHADNVSCLECTAPICEECADCVFADDPTVPPAGLSNGMMIYDAPSILYRENVSVMGMICASVCITSMISFTLEKKYRGSRSMDQKHNANKHRMGARGNATSFPLPWEDLLKQLQDGEEMAKLGKHVSLPRSGTQLADVVSVLLKTAAGDDTEKDVAKLIHQCTVRRHIVVKLIQTMKERGHKAYKHVDMDQVARNANALPEAPQMIVKDCDIILSVSSQGLIEKLPDYDERRQILATDSLASVDGFRIMIQLTSQLNSCPTCPVCNHDKSNEPCQDLFGSNATAEGGLLGRVDAAYTSVESQKSTGSLHEHSQVFVQCLHQHTNIYQILDKLRERPDSIVREHLQYKEHV